MLRAFVLIQHTVSWDGSASDERVAEGIEFSDGRVALRTCLSTRASMLSSSTWDSIEDMQDELTDGRTRIGFAPIDFNFGEDITHVDVLFTANASQT